MQPGVNMFYLGPRQPLSQRRRNSHESVCRRITTGVEVLAAQADAFLLVFIAPVMGFITMTIGGLIGLWFGRHRQHRDEAHESKDQPPSSGVL